VVAQWLLTRQRYWSVVPLLQRRIPPLILRPEWRHLAEAGLGASGRPQQRQCCHESWCDKGLQVHLRRTVISAAC
jgi:hypothetical protein